MAKAELLEETGSSSSIPGPVDVMIGITGVVDLAAIRSTMSNAAAAFERTLPGARLAIAHVDMGEDGDVVAGDSTSHAVRVLSYKPIASPGSGANWLTSSATFSSLFALSRATGAKACVIVSADMAAFDHQAAASLAAPILAGECELSMPIYAQGRFAGLLNAGILSPLTRALYGKRVRYPLAQDFGVAPASAASLRAARAPRAGRKRESFLAGDRSCYPGAQSVPGPRRHDSP